MNTLKKNINRHLDIEVGDSKQVAFHPQVKIKKWDNESNFSVRYEDLELVDPVTEDGKIKIKNEKKEVHLYDTKIDLKHEHYQHGFAIDYTKSIEYKIDGFEQLVIDGKIIGRDSEEERNERQRVATEIKGDVLIAGLGLGVILEYLDKAKSVTVVEISQEVVDLLREKYPERLANIKIIVADIFDYLDTTQDTYDFIYGDIFPYLLPAHIYEYEIFKEKAQRILKHNGIINTRITEYAEQFKMADFSQDGYEFEILLKEKPNTNIFSFSVQSKNVEFLYQPALSEEDLAEGDFRPESVIGSYAIYHTSKSNNKYETGKVAHIYRPKAHDANGKWVYGELNYHDGKIDISIPQDFLASAVYPILIDPTFGYTSVGATSTGSVGAATIRTSQFTSLAGTGVSMSIYFISKTSGIGGTGGIFTRSGTTNTLLANSATASDTNVVTNNWLTVAFTSPPTFTATTYDIAGYVAAVGKGAGNSMAYDTGSTNQGTQSSNADPGNSYTYPTLPASYTITTLSTNKYSIYVTYNLTPLIDKVSSSDAGFTAGHPFASGAATNFTVQVADTLANSTTYYWRVRAIDPSGSNTYGAWSSSKSFTTLPSSIPNKIYQINQAAKRASNY